MKISLFIIIIISYFKYVQQVRLAGVEVEIQHYEEMVHVFPMFAATGMDVCYLAFTRMRVFIEEQRRAFATRQEKLLCVDDINPAFTDSSDHDSIQSSPLISVSTLPYQDTNLSSPLIINNPTQDLSTDRK